MGKRNETVFETFNILQFEIVDGEPQIQGVTTGGKKREFTLALHRDKRDNSVGMHVVRHYTDPDSVPYYEDSEPWTSVETEGDRE